jgi:urea transporter
MNQPAEFLENSPELWMGILLAAAIAIALPAIATKGVRTKKLDA